MAYALRYYKEIAQADGGVVRLEIHKKDGTTSAVEIGAVVQGLSLEIQGQQDDVDTPIQKTSLHMTFVDAQDIENGQKNGFWEEFYTPDALMWKVILKAKDAGETAFRTIWGGYVTPDSFSEDLVYRGSVSITARDNIGHMQDFPFDAMGDADGLISLYNLVMGGWEKIQSPMDLLWNGLDWLSCNGVIAYNTLMNVSQFKDMNWYKAIETALASYGAVMRYAGENEVYVTTLRYMPSLGRNIELMDHIEPVFISGAQRELVPAVKRIEENVDYDLEESISQPQIKVSDFSGSTETYRCKIDGVDNGNGSFGTLEHDAPIWPINNAEIWANVAGKSLFFNPHAYEIGYFSDRRGLDDEIKRFMYIASNNVDERSVSFSKTITCADLAIRIKFGLPISLNNEGSSMTIEQQNVFNLKSIRYSVALVQNGVTNYLASHGGWVVDKQEITTEFDTSSQVSDFECIIGMGEFIGQADITFTIHKIEYAQMSYANLADYGLYACIQDFALATPASLSLREKNTVNTLYNADNNVILSRDPELGPAFDRVVLPQMIKNGIFYRNGDEILPARLWSWGGSEQQMAVWNHLQLLCYYAKPNNLISGTIVNADLSRVANIWVWHGAEHILVSGRFNFLNGHIEGAVLREFARYEDMWSEVAGAGMPDTEEESKSNVEGGSAGSGASSTYTNTTNVTIGGEGGGGITTITKQMVIEALGYTPYNAANPSGYITMSALGGYATQSWVEGKGYATQSWVEGKGYALNATLADYLPLSGGRMKGDVTFDLSYGIKTISGGNVLHGDDSSIVVGGVSSLLRLTSTSSVVTTIGTNTITKATDGAFDITAKTVISANQYVSSADTLLPNEYSADLIVGGNTLFRGEAYFYKEGNSSLFAINTVGLLMNFMVNHTPSSSSAMQTILTLGTGTSYLNSPLQITATTASKAIRLNENGTVHTLGVASSNLVYNNSVVLTESNYSDYVSGGGGGIDKITSAMITEALGYTPYNAANPNGYITASALGGYLSTSGGTITGQLNVTNINGYTPITSGNIGSQSVASATKLATQRTIWGQPFNGTGDIGGDLTLGNEIRLLCKNTGGTALDILRVSSANSLTIGYGLAGVGDTYITGNSVYFRYGGNRAVGLKLNSSGNVGIGTSSPSQKLHVAGNILATGTVTQGSDIRFKHRMNNVCFDLYVMANAPLFNFYWSDRIDNQIHLGTSAQYWEMHCNELVSGTDFKGLDYSTLGVAMGISLAKKAVNLEDRIKVLEDENKDLKEQISRIRYGS